MGYVPPPPPPMRAITPSLSSAIYFPNRIIPQQNYCGWDCDYCGRYNVSIEKNCEGCGSAYHRSKKINSIKPTFPPNQLVIL
jgi:hypothetical protein